MLSIRLRLVIAALAATTMVGCGHRAGERTTPPAETGGVAAPREDANGAFAAKVDEVETYMKQHDVSNTPTAELRAALASFQKDFQTLAAETTDVRSAEKCRLAAESMGLYVKSLDASADAAAARDLALDAQKKWRRAREAGNKRQ